MKQKRRNHSQEGLSPPPSKAGLHTRQALLQRADFRLPLVSHEKTNTTANDTFRYACARLKQNSRPRSQTIKMKKKNTLRQQKSKVPPKPKATSKGQVSPKHKSESKATEKPVAMPEAPPKPKVLPTKQKPRVKTQMPYAAEVEGSSVLRKDPAPCGDSSVLQKQVDEKRLKAIDLCDAALKNAYADKLQLAPSLNRSLVSFQANKTRAVFRWFKYKEAFSSALVEYLLQQYRVKTGVILDPFAGIGTALFAAGGTLKGEGIELLPIGQIVIETRQLIDWKLEPADVDDLERWVKTKPWKTIENMRPIPDLRITKGAYPPETLEAMGRYLFALDAENERVRAILLFALLCILEGVSYTRKDGQYLRWDYRSGRRQGKKIFDKGTIHAFDPAIVTKLTEIVYDLRNIVNSDELFATNPARTEITLHSGSCLQILPKMPAARYSGILTSPPYCNRYDYTRTYALELALLGVDEDLLRHLRQEMLSCTVENRAKDLLALHPDWRRAVEVADRQPLLQEILSYLDDQREKNLLNNNGIARMVRGYFYEMACVIQECARVLQPGAPLIMVNDNVRYAGASISVDLILSEFARELGFVVETILVLPTGKGNSSQQMGAHGREPLRKCVYVWRKV
jgi:DNA modification methylase